MELTLELWYRVAFEHLNLLRKRQASCYFSDVWSTIFVIPNLGRDLYELSKIHKEHQVAYSHFSPLGIQEFRQTLSSWGLHIFVS